MELEKCKRKAKENLWFNVDIWTGIKYNHICGGDGWGKRREIILEKRWRRCQSVKEKHGECGITEVASFIYYYVTNHLKPSGLKQWFNVLIILWVDSVGLCFCLCSFVQSAGGLAVATGTLSKMAPLTRLEPWCTGCLEGPFSPHGLSLYTNLANAAFTNCVTLGQVSYLTFWTSISVSVKWWQQYLLYHKIVVMKYKQLSAKPSVLYVGSTQ